MEDHGTVYETRTKNMREQIAAIVRGRQRGNPSPAIIRAEPPSLYWR